MMLLTGKNDTRLLRLVLHKPNVKKMLCLCCSTFFITYKLVTFKFKQKHVVVF